ncbi:MAG: Rpp14/Pop5 family protein [Candidatus Aenigmarchaeota archaeon]|nr:Rpp14/Pop5 family protein [Candidatus Aenigmarchaeota archaeon]
MRGKNQLKFLLPTLRERERYIAFKIISEEPVVYEDIEQAIWNVALDFFGEHGVSKMSMYVIKSLYDIERQIGVVRCNNKSVSQVISCLGLISRLGDTRVIFKILKVSGTIKGLKL